MHIVFNSTRRNKTVVTLLLALLACFSRVSGAVQPLIFPVPQQVQLTSDSFVLDETTVIAVSENALEKDLSLARLLVKELSNKYGVALAIISVKVVPKGHKAIVMGSMTNDLVKQYHGNEHIAPDGYLMEVTDSLVMVAGGSDTGAFYGLQSLRQLLRAGNGKTVPGIKVRDWPAFPFRAIRLYVPGPENMTFFKRFISDFMALYKYNKVIIEFNCMRLDRHPEVNTGWLDFVKYMQYTRSNSTEGLRGEEKNSSHYDAGDGFIIEKEAVRELVAFARKNYLEVIPEIPSLTHAYYLLSEHPELAEYPGDTWPDTYCPSNPASYKLMFDVYDEYLEVIKPAMVHIGHDEWWGAPVGVCPRCRNKSYPALYASDVRKLHTYFDDRGIKIAMWGDYMLESVRGKGTQKRVSSTGANYETPGAMSPAIVRDSIPKDILVFNWFWGDENKETQLNDMGFQQVYGNFTPNISNWEQRTKKIDVLGGAPSSWASTNEFNFGKDLMLDFLGCANLLWSGRTITQKDLQKIVWRLLPSIRTDLKGKRPPSEDENIVEPVDISAFYNLPVDSTVFSVDLRQMRRGEIRKGSKLFELQEAGGHCIAAVCAEGDGDCPLPDRITGIPIGEDVSSLVFLHACALPSHNQKAYFNIPNNFDSADLLGWYEIVYEDGLKEIVPLQYGVNILEWSPGGEKSLDTLEGETGAPQRAYCYEADPVNCSNNSDTPVFFAYEWVNKRFGKIIKEVRLHGSVRYQSLQQNYGKVETKPMKSNAILLAGISKVKKKEPYKPIK